MNFKKLAIAASAAAAATPAMAADLPVVAEPVEYVEVCSAAGAGYFKLPGKDTCLSISGKNRVTFTTHDLTASHDDVNNKYAMRAEGFVYFDAISFNEFATIKTHLEFEGQWDKENKNATIGTGNVYVQLGFDNVTVTAGRTGTAWKQFGGFSSIGVIGISNGGEDGLGLNVAASLGNGFTAEFAVEDTAPYEVTASNDWNYIGTLSMSQGMFSADLSGAAYTYANDEKGYAVAASAEFAATDKVTLGLGAAYASNALTLIDASSTGVSDGEDATGFVVGAGVKVAMTDMLTGALDVSYASTKDDNGDDDEFNKTVVNGSLAYSPVAGLSMIVDAGWARSEANGVDSDEAKIATRLQYAF